MGHPIIFKTKFVNFSDGRIMHLSLQGCNNDAEGRNNDDWQIWNFRVKSRVKEAP